MMKVKNSICFVFLALFHVASWGGTTIGFQGGSLEDENGNPMPESGTIVLVADTAGDGFAPISTSSSFQEGGFTDVLDGIVDDLVIVANIGHGSGGTLPVPGYVGYQSSPFEASSFESFGGNSLSSGDPIALLWLPSVSSVSGDLSGARIGYDSSYGFYSSFSYDGITLSSSSLLPSDMGAGTYGTIVSGNLMWSFPGDTPGGSHDLIFYDSFGENPIPDYYTQANFSAVPEPSTYAAILGVVGLIYVGYRRRKNKAAA